MCIPAILPALGALGGAGAATAAGAGASALTFGSLLQGVGTVLAVGSTLAQGIATNRAAKVNVQQIEEQKQTEAQLNSVREQRSNKEFRAAIAQQRADLAGRGVSLDSPTAVFLGQNAAREMAFQGQTIRQGGQATQTELTNSQRAIRARGRSALFTGGLSAAGKLLKASPTLWPELLS